MKINLTREQHKNLIEFLMRTSMNGKEAIAFMDLIGAINKSALSITDNPNKDKK